MKNVIMKAKYDWMVDHPGLRLAVKALVFGVWLVACAVLLSL